MGKKHIDEIDDENDLEADEKNDYALVNDVVLAMSDLPIITRLEMVQNLIHQNGGCRHSDPQSQMMIVAYEVLNEVTQVIRKHPAAAKVRTLGLKSGD